MLNVSDFNEIWLLTGVGRVQVIEFFSDLFDK